MSHINNKTSDLLTVVQYDKMELRKLRKSRNLWYFGAVVAMIGAIGIVLLFMPQGPLQTVIGLAILWPVYVVVSSALRAKWTYVPEASVAGFIGGMRKSFASLVDDPELTQESSRYVDLDVTKSNHHAGLLRVEAYRLLDAPSSPRDPEAMPMVFEIGETSIASNGADPQMVLPLLLDAISGEVTARQRGRELTSMFRLYELPAGIGGNA